MNELTIKKVDNGFTVYWWIEKDAADYPGERHTRIFSDLDGVLDFVRNFEFSL